MRKTKIIGTLGPASINEKTIEELLRSGMNVVRLNFSHGDHAYHQNSIDLVKKVRDRLKVPAAIMLDTKGPEIRLANFEQSKVILEEGQRFTLTSKEILGDQTRVSVTYKELPSQLKKGDQVLIDDGKVRLEVLECTEDEVRCTVLVGGEIANHKLSLIHI